MMELICAFLFIFSSVVSATPHGYGVKGGAAARAESSASAGAFGGLGAIPVPLGAGYSGSFSKSSSSSFASSSASSSASASSFSFSGSGGGFDGFGSNDGKQTSVECSTGHCQDAGGNGATVPHGVPHNGYNAAGSVSSAGAGAFTGAGGLTGSGCEGSHCKNNEKCSSEQCKSKTQSGTPSTVSNDNKCATGQCGSNGASSTDYNSNDIRVVSGSSETTQNSKDKSSTGYDSASSDCSQGNCAPSAPFSSKPNTGHSSSYSYQGNTHQSSSDSEAHHKPASHLEAPKLNTKCNSPNCSPESIEPVHGSSPSSYNVPIHGTYDNEPQKPKCDGVKCENQPKGSYPNSLSTNYLSPQTPLNSYTTPSNCEGSICFGAPSSQTVGGPSLTLRPGKIQFGHPSSVTPGCNTPNCGSYSGITTSLNAPSASGPNEDVNKSGAVKPNENLPAYTGGFGGPAGIFKPNEFDNAAKPPANSNYVHPNVPHKERPVEDTAAGCNSPSCSGFPSASGANVQTGTFGLHKPVSAIGVSSEKLPMYTGGFGGPAGMLKPNEYGIPSTAFNKPSYGQSSSSFENSATSCNTPNCGGHSPSASGGSHTSSGTAHPSVGGTTNEKVPTYTGGFGGPTGVFKPNEYDTPTTASHSYSPSGTYNTQNGNLPGCNTSNCYNSNLASTAAINSQHSATDSHHTSGTPDYTSSHDRPTGIKPTYGHSPSASTPSSSTGCNSANCAGPQNSGSFGRPSDTLKPNDNSYNTAPLGNTPVNCKTGNCGNLPTGSAGVISGSNPQSGSFAVSKPAGSSNDKLPVYTGGFGGASGILKPHDYTVPAIKPLTSTGAAKPNGCTSGNCNDLVPHGSAPHAHNDVTTGAHAIATSKAEANAAVYTGGFGGPPGVLKPYDDGKVGPTPNNGGHPGSQISGHYSSPSASHLSHDSKSGAGGAPANPTNINPSHLGSQSNTGAQSVSVSGATAYSGSGAAYGYNTHGSHYNPAEGGIGGSPCGGGCGGSGYNSGSNLDLSSGNGKLGYSDGLNGERGTTGAAAKSLAGASAFGLGGSFASSSASAHASAGAYTKGGYGKR